MTPPKTLPEQCEAASGGSRELDFAILCIVDPRAVKTGPLPGDPRYTTSIDAALSIVPEGWRINYLQQRITPKLHTIVRLLCWKDEASGKAATPALALCAAALRARESHAREPLTEEGN